MIFALAITYTTINYNSGAKTDKSSTIDNDVGFTHQTEFPVSLEITKGYDFLFSYVKTPINIYAAPKVYKPDEFDLIKNKSTNFKTDTKNKIRNFSKPVADYYTIFGLSSRNS